MNTSAKLAGVALLTVAAVLVGRTFPRTDRYELHSGPLGWFELDRRTGRVWKYNLERHMFYEVPTVSFGQLPPEGQVKGGLNENGQPKFDPSRPFAILPLNPGGDMVHIFPGESGAPFQQH